MGNFYMAKENNTDDNTVKIEAYDLETNEIVEIEIDREALEMIDRAEREMKERLEEQNRLDTLAMIHSLDNN
jgi:hypothetical protein